MEDDCKMASVASPRPAKADPVSKERSASLRFRLLLSALAPEGKVLSPDWNAEAVPAPIRVSKAP